MKQGGIFFATFAAVPFAAKQNLKSAICNRPGVTGRQDISDFRFQIAD
jgi:hypothetical protein